MSGALPSDRATAASQSSPQAVSSRAGIPSAKPYRPWKSSDFGERLRATRNVVARELLCIAHTISRNIREGNGVQARSSDYLKAVDEIERLTAALAQEIEARRAETGEDTGSVHESAVGNADAPEHSAKPHPENHHG